MSTWLILLLPIKTIHIFYPGEGRVLSEMTFDGTTAETKVQVWEAS